MSETEREVMTVEQVATLWGVSIQTIINLFDRGTLQGFTFTKGPGKRRTIRIYKDSVRDVMYPRKKELPEDKAVPA